MSKKQTDKLVLLVSSLNKAEKKSFRLYANRNQEASEKLFFQLFELIDKVGYIDEAQILKKIPKLKKSQISNVKANLYRQILSCLRLIKSKSIDEIKARELLDFAKILYDKGLYKQALETLEKAKRLAISINYETLVLSILYFEKRIESQHVTGSMAGRAKDLADHSNFLIEEIDLTNQLSNLSLMLYGKYLQYGYVKNEKDYLHISEYFESNKPNVRLDELNFYQKLYLIQSYVWFYNMTQNFAMCYKFSNRWLDLFHRTPEAKYSETPLYLKGLHNVMNSLFMAQKEERFFEVFEELKAFNLNEKVNSTDNEQGLYKLILHLHTLNSIFLDCRYDLGVTKIVELEEEVALNTYNWDLNRLMVFYYKLACVYFGNQQSDRALSYLNLINNKYYPSFREDIQCFSRILSLIVHFDLGNVELVNYQLRQVYRFLLKLQELDAVLIEILAFLRRTPQMKPENMSREFSKLKIKLIGIKHKRFEKRPFLYLDIISWLDTKITKQSFQEVLLQNRAERINA